MTATPVIRKFVLTAHVTASVGWLGAVVAYLGLAVSAMTSQDGQTVRAAWTAMELTGWFVIVPLALSSVLIGVVNALVTPWGLFRHYWVLVKFLLTIAATIILVAHMPTVSHFAGVAAEATNPSGSWGELLHAGGGLLVLLVATVLSIYKPRGMTRYGWRKQHEQRKVSRPIPPRSLATTRSSAEASIADRSSHSNSDDGGFDRESSTGGGDRESSMGGRWRLYVLLAIIGLVLLIIFLHLVGGGLPRH